MTQRVAVVGGGLAGISAAIQCLDAGADVTLLESRPALGGLTTSFKRGSLDVDNGQHVFLRCCTAYRRLLTRLGVERDVMLQDRLDVGVLMPGDDRTTRLRRTGLPAPLHLAGSLLRYSPLSPADRLRAVRGTLALRRLDLSDPRLDDTSFGEWLRAHGQNRSTIDALWDLFGIATHNAHADQASLAMATMVFQTGLFTEADAGDIGWSLVPLLRLHGESAHRALSTGGASVRTKAKVERIEARGNGWLVAERDGPSHEVDLVVLAVPPAQAEALLPAGSVSMTAGWSKQLGTSPIVNVHAVYDRRVMETPFVASVGTPAQWVFDRTGQSGLEHGQYLAVSISAADDLIDVTTAKVRERVLPALEQLFPATRQAQLLDFFVTRERTATFLAAPGTARLRPGPRTGHEGLVLAGAWTDTGWPATMESAVRSGEAAAAALRLGASSSDEKGSIAA
jgi:squalene-associated FAD-dependent desaturase